MPLFVKKFLVDFIETGVIAILGLNFAGDPAAVAHAIGIAIGAALLSAARRTLPDFLAFVEEQGGTRPNS